MTKQQVELARARAELARRDTANAFAAAPSPSPMLQRTDFTNP
jgi:hypothetical protein